MNIVAMVSSHLSVISWVDFTHTYISSYMYLHTMHIHDIY